MQDIQSYCTGCGHLLPAGAQFCPACGGRILPATGTVPGTLPGPPSSEWRWNVFGMILAGAGFLGLLGLLLLSLRSPSVPSHTPRRTPVAIPTGAATPGPEKVVPEPLSFRTVTHEELGFQIEIPREWVTEPQEGGFTLSPVDDSADSSEIWGSVSHVPRQPGRTLQSQVQQVKEEMREYFKLVIDAEDSLTIEDQPALRLKYHHFQSAVDTMYTGITVVLERKEDFLTLALQYATDRELQYEPVVEHIINSLRPSRP